MRNVAPKPLKCVKLGTKKTGLPPAHIKTLGVIFLPCRSGGCSGNKFGKQQLPILPAGNWAAIQSVMTHALPISGKTAKNIPVTLSKRHHYVGSYHHLWKARVEEVRTCFLLHRGAVHSQDGAITDIEFYNR